MKLYTRTWGDKARKSRQCWCTGDFQFCGLGEGWTTLGRVGLLCGGAGICEDTGASPKPDSEYGLDTMVNDLADSVPFNPDVLVGHSYGV